MITDSSGVSDSEVLANRVALAPAETTAEHYSSKGIDANERYLSTDHLLTDLKGRTVSLG